MVQKIRCSYMIRFIKYSQNLGLKVFIQMGEGWVSH